MVVIWIGGVGYGGVETYPGVEFNLRNDIAAANVVFDSGITIWQVPSNVYSHGVGQLHRARGEDRRHQQARGLPDQPDGRVERAPILAGADRVSLPRGFAGRLPDAVSPRRQFPHRSRPLASVRKGHYLPGSGHPIRVVESVDVRFLLEDMFAKIRKFGRDRP